MDVAKIHIEKYKFKKAPNSKDISKYLLVVGINLELGGLYFLAIIGCN